MVSFGDPLTEFASFVGGRSGSDSVRIATSSHRNGPIFASLNRSRKGWRSLRRTMSPTGCPVLSCDVFEVIDVDEDEDDELTHPRYSRKVRRVSCRTLGDCAVPSNCRCGLSQIGFDCWVCFFELLVRGAESRLQGRLLAHDLSQQSHGCERLRGICASGSTVRCRVSVSASISGSTGLSLGC